MVLLSLLCFPLAYLTYRFIERPFRGKSNLFTRRQIAFFSGITILGIFTFGLTGHKTEGFISSYHIEKKENNKISLIVDLKYYEGNPVIKDIRRISKPGRRVYSRATSIPRIQNGLGLAIISTNKGVMSDIEARKNNIGGEIICRVF